MEKEYWVKRLVGEDKQSIDFSSTREEAECIVAECILNDAKGNYIIEEEAV